MSGNHPLPRWFTAEKPHGWFSRRHRTSDANNQARDRYLEQRGPMARRRRAMQRAAEAAARAEEEDNK